MTLATGKLIIAMVYPKMLIKANIHQTIITAPAVRMNHCADLNMTPYNALQRGFRAIWHNLCIDFACSLQYPKHNGFAVSAASALLSNGFDICNISPVY